MLDVLLGSVWLEDGVRLVQEECRRMAVQALFHWRELSEGSILTQRRYRPAGLRDEGVTVGRQPLILDALSRAQLDAFVGQRVRELLADRVHEVVIACCLQLYPTRVSVR